ncbi:MAG: hypothetical protein NZM04_01065 [Methylacidiphilales bacterium]|nr:hypothetical protein [Candidatus Methylacidiphilales bacterium]
MAKFIFIFLFLITSVSLFSRDRIDLNDLDLIIVYEISDGKIKDHCFIIKSNFNSKVTSNLCKMLFHKFNSHRFDNADRLLVTLNDGYKRYTDTNVILTGGVTTYYPFNSYIKSDEKSSNISDKGDKKNALISD